MQLLCVDDGGGTPLVFLKGDIERCPYIACMWSEQVFDAIYNGVKCTTNHSHGSNHGNA